MIEETAIREMNTDPCDKDERPGKLFLVFLSLMTAADPTSENSYVTPNNSRKRLNDFCLNNWEQVSAVISAAHASAGKRDLSQEESAKKKAKKMDHLVGSELLSQAYGENIHTLQIQIKKMKKKSK